MNRSILAILVIACAALFAPPAHAQWKKNNQGTTLQGNAGPLNLGNQAITGVSTLSAGAITIGGTSYGGSIQATTFVSPTITGTATVNGVALSGTTTGGRLNSATLGSPTISAPTITGTATVNGVALSGTTTGGVLSGATLAGPTMTGTASINNAVLSTGSTGYILLLTGTGITPAGPTLAVSGTALYFYNGSAWKAVTIAE